MIQNFNIEKDTLCSTDASALQALIPDVKQLLQSFPEKKDKTKLALSFDEVRNRVYQFETRLFLNGLTKAHWNLTVIL
jgi:hypothetical protein